MFVSAVCVEQQRALESGSSMMTLEVRSLYADMLFCCFLQQAPHLNQHVHGTKESGTATVFPYGVSDCCVVCALGGHC